jgi:hypothetical protein
MKRIYVALFCGFLGILLMGAAIPPQVNGQAEAEIPNGNLVTALRLLNTQEYNYRYESGRFAALQEMLGFLRTKGCLSKSPIDLENPKPYELTITTSPDVQHYQIALRPNDEKAACKTAAFSDDSGLIYLGSVIGCESPTR